MYSLILLSIHHNTISLPRTGNIITTHRKYRYRVSVMMLPCLGNNRYLWHQSVNIRQTAVTGGFYRHINAKGWTPCMGSSPFCF